MERKIIQDKLRKKELEIQSLEEKIKAGRIYIQALQDVLRLLDVDTADVGDTPLKSGSTVDKAREIILKRAAPVHVNELLEALGKGVTRESRASLVSSLAAYVRKGEVFTRPAPNTFGLIELGHIAPQVPSAPPQPPQGFGKIAPSAPFEPQEKSPSDGFEAIDDEIKF